MNRISLLITCVSIFFLTSCKETVDEDLMLLIQNSTDSPLQVTLYPKEHSGDLYPICEGCGGHKLTEYTLSPHDGQCGNWDEVIFTSTDLGIEPYTLASLAFDSIHISLSDKDSTVIKFTPEKVTGYSENIFTENSTWDYCIDEWNRQLQFSKNPQKDHCYSFFISEDKMINKGKDENTE